MDALHPRRILSRVILSCALLVSVGALSQCRMVNDSITGVDLSATAKIDGQDRKLCVHDCQARYHAAVKAENNRYRDAFRSCGSNVTCRQNQLTLHRNTLTQLRKTERDCRGRCYNEGSGDGGR